MWGSGAVHSEARRPARQLDRLSRLRGFVLRFFRVDILHAVEHAVVLEEIDGDPLRWLVIGPDRAALFLGLVVLDRPQGPAVIHAMPMRTKYQRLLTKKR